MIKCFLIGVSIWILIGCENKPINFENNSSNSKKKITLENKKDALVHSLGQYLFFDTRLSINNTKSCASCHNPNLYFTDGYKRTLGAYADIQLRNTPTLLNAISYKSLNWANPSITRLEQQMTTPLFSKSHFEMGMDNTTNDQAIQILKKYQNFEAAQKKENQNWEFIISNISDYVSKLVSRNSKYDFFLKSNDSSILSEDEKQGMNLFFSNKLNCFKCHGGLDFNISKEAGNQFVNTNIYTLSEYKLKEDKGLFLETNKLVDVGKFRVPTLRNITKTAPYMHDGSLANLNHVVAHYSKKGIHPLLKGFEISQHEKNQLISFLETLTDTTIFSNPIFQNPFKP